MKSRLFAIAAALGFSALGAGGAQAAAITYIFGGQGAFTLNGVAEDSAFQFVYKGDTTNVTFSAGEFTNDIAPGDGSFMFGSTMVTLGGDVNRIIDNTAAPGFAGFAQITTTPFNVAVEALTNAVFKTYDLKTPIGPVTGGLSVGPATYSTSGGLLVFGATDIQALGFVVTGGVPEPSTWALMVAGFAGLGWLGYTRRRAIGSAAA